MRKNIVAGNWKMNNDLAETKTLISELKNQTKSSNAELMIAPTFTNLLTASESLDFKPLFVPVVVLNLSSLCSILKGLPSPL